MEFKNGIWLKKIQAANKYYQEWENLFEIAQLEAYYERRQWRGRFQQVANSYRPYVLNMIFSAIQTKLAAILIKHPEYELTPTPGNMDWNQQEAVQSALLKQDVINAIVSNPNLNFTRHLKLVALDSFFRFGIIEINHSADFSNPLKAPVITTEYTKENVDPENAKVIEDIELPLTENIYFKHIKAKRFRVSTSDSPFLNNCSWCGDYSFVYESTLMNTQGIKIPKAYTTGMAIDHSGPYSDRIINTTAAMQSAKTLKLWRIFDNERKLVHRFIDGFFDESIDEEDVHFDVLPFEDLIHFDRVPGIEDAGYYPMPVVYNWMSPQDDINEAREQMRNLRRRYTRKFGYLKGKVEIEEIEKFKSEYDGELIEWKTEDAIKPIDNPTLGATITADLQAATDDFNKIAAVSQTQESDRTTATQSKINAARETLREDTEQMDFSDFICRAGRKGLLIAKEKLVSGIWVKYTQDTETDLFGEVQSNAPIYQFVSSQHIDDGYDFTVAIKVIDASPDRMDSELQKYLMFLKVLFSYPAIAMSPKLIMETAYKCGYRNLAVIREMQKMALVSMMGQVQQGQQGMLEDQAGASQTSNTTPTKDSTIDAQIGAQV